MREVTEVDVDASARGVRNVGASFNVPQQSLRDVGHLDLVAARVDHQRLRVPRELFDAIFGHVSVSAEQLHRLHRDVGRGSRRVELHRGGLGKLTGLPACARSMALNTMFRTLTRAISISAELELDELEVADALPHSVR